MLLVRGGDAGAEAAFRRAAERGVAKGAYNLGLLLERAGDVEGAEAAYTRAAMSSDEHAAESAAAALRVLAERRPT